MSDKTGYDAYAARRPTAMPDEVAQELAAYESFQKRMNLVRWMLGAFFLVALVVVILSVWIGKARASFVPDGVIKSKVEVAAKGTFGDNIACNPDTWRVQY